MEDGLIIGFALGVFSVTLFSDLLGKRNATLVGLGILLLGLVITLVGSVDWIRFIGLLLWGLGGNAIFVVQFSLISDIVAR